MADAPPSFTCPLTLEVMADPVTAADGHSYERASIEQWLRSSSISPLTGAALAHRNVTPNHALRNAIQDFKAAAKPKAPPAPPRVAAGQPPKTILLGDSSVGKTSLVHRVKEGTFKQDSLQSTIGCSFCEHSATLPHGGPLRLAVWDTAGQEKYRSFTRQYFRNTSAAIIMYDVTSRSSFDGVKAWLEELEAAGLSPDAIALVIVGSKADRAADERAVPMELGRELADSLGAVHLEASSKDGTNCAEVFEHVARVLAERGLVSESGGASGGGGSTPRSGTRLLLRRESSAVRSASACACLG